MSANVAERSLFRVPWTTVSGERSAVFQALGEHARDDITYALGALRDVAALRSRIDRDPALARHLRAVIDAGGRRFPEAIAELVALAAGAQVPVDDLLLLNHRGDLGAAAVEGCTDVVWCDRDRALLGHNEDGPPELDGRCRLLTLEIDGDPAITAWWYPGFLPSNTFTFNGAGLVSGVDHVAVARPAIAPGRALVARAAQRSRSLEEALRVLETTPSAGGFSYTLGQVGEATIHTVEAAAGQTARASAGGRPVFSVHANHLTLLPGELDLPEQESLDRALDLDAATPPGAPDPDWLLELLLTDRPAGARRHGDPLLTLATFVVELPAGELTVAARGSEPQRMKLPGSS